jgi:hypothetical protein
MRKIITRVVGGMNLVDRLLFLPSPKSDESLWGYIQRVTTENHYETTSWLYKSLGFYDKYNKGLRQSNLSILEENENIKKLSRLLGLSEQNIKKLSFFYLIPTNSEKKLQNHIYIKLKRLLFKSWKTKVCPKCLNEHLYYRKVWELDLYQYCDIHKCYLISKCPACLRLISLKDVPIGKCLCGKSFKEVKVKEYISDNNKNFSSFLANINNNLLSITKGENYLEKLSPFHSYFLILYFRDLLYNHQITETQNDCNVEAFLIFENWPYSFYQFLNRVKQTPKYQNFTGIRKDFGTMYRDILIKYNDEIFEFLVEEFEKYLYKIWDGGHLIRVSKLGRSNNVIDKKYLTGKEVKQRLKIGHIKFQELISTNVLESKILLTDKRKKILVSKKSIDEYELKEAKYLPFNNVKDILGINKKLINKLITNKVLKVAEYNPQKIELRSVLKLVNSFEKNSKESEIDDKMISFQYCIRIMRYYVNEDIAIVKLIRLVANRMLIPFKINDEKGIKKYNFNKKQVIELCKQLYLSDFLNLKDAADFLDVDYRSLSFWIKRGLIEKSEGQNSTFISKVTILSFQKKYITLGRLAKDKNLSPMTVKAKLKLKGIKPISGTKIDGGRSYLYLREELF